MSERPDDLSSPLVVSSQSDKKAPGSPYWVKSPAIGNEVSIAKDVIDMGYTLPPSGMEAQSHADIVSNSYSLSRGAQQHIDTILREKQPTYGEEKKDEAWWGRQLIIPLIAVTILSVLMAILSYLNRYGFWCITAIISIGFAGLLVYIIKKRYLQIRSFTGLDNIMTVG